MVVVCGSDIHDYECTTETLPWQGGHQCSLQLLYVLHTSLLHVQANPLVLLWIRLFFPFIEGRVYNFSWIEKADYLTKIYFLNPVYFYSVVSRMTMLTIYRGDHLVCFCPDHECIAYAILNIRRLTWMYCICHQVYCICNHLTSRATLGCTTLALKCTAEGHAVLQEPHLGVLQLSSSVL